MIMLLKYFSTTMAKETVVPMNRLETTLLVAISPANDIEKQEGQNKDDHQRTHPNLLSNPTLPNDNTIDASILKGSFFITIPWGEVTVSNGPLSNYSSPLNPTTSVAALYSKIRQAKMMHPDDPNQVTATSSLIMMCLNGPLKTPSVCNSPDHVNMVIIL